MTSKNDDWLKEALISKSLTIFLGMDLPLEITGVPSRSELATRLAERKGFDRSLSLADVAQRVSQSSSRRWEFTSFVRDQLDTTGKAPRAFHERIVKLAHEFRIETIISTAYDNLLDIAFQQARLGFNRVVRGSDINFINPNYTTLIKLYGDIQQPDTLTITEQDHLNLLRDQEKAPILDEVRRAFRRNTVFFIGYNLADIDFRFIFDQIGENRLSRAAYAIWPSLPETDINMWRERGINILDSDPFGILSKRNVELSPNTRTLDELVNIANPLPDQHGQGDDIMDYRLGLNLLREYIQQKGSALLVEYATLEERFTKNEKDERLFGISENTRNVRSQIIYALNEMALTHCGVSFTQLCLKGQTGLSNNPHEKIIESLERIENKIDQGRAEDRDIAVQILDLLSQNSLKLDDANQIMLDLQQWARTVQESGLPISPDLRAQLDTLCTNTSGVTEYFQLAIPLIPGLLSYNVELGGQHQINLQAVWTRMKAKIKSRSKGDGKKLGEEKIYGKGSRWAVVIGANQYEDKTHYGELHVCINDANAISDCLLTNGYHPEHLRLLTDKTSDLPTRDNILIAVNAIAKATDPNDTLIFFYSGHGDYVNGESYLVTRNGKRLALEDTAVKVSRIKEIMVQAPAKAKVIILDACHSGANIEGKGPKCMTEEFIRRVFEQAEGLAILASCKQGQVSYEWQTNERSVFTYYLLEGLQGQADLDEKGFVTLQDINRHVNNGVKLWACQRNREQTPTLQAEMAGDIIIAHTERHTVNP